MIRRSFQLSGSYDVIKDVTDLEAIEKLIQGKDGPILTSYDPVPSPKIRDGEQNNVYSTSPGNSTTNSAASTPTAATKRSTRRRTMIIFKEKKEKELFPEQDVGSGRAIPIKQGYLYKRSSNSIKQEWKKKYVTLLDNGKLVYYPNMHDYMDDIHAKTLNLKHTTVKIPGKRPPKASSASSQSQSSDSRPTTPIDPVLTGTDNNNATPDSLSRNSTCTNNVQNGLTVECSSDHELSNAIASISNQVVAPASSNAGLSSNRDSNSSSVVKRKNKRSKHPKSCEIDYEELEKALAAANIAMPSSVQASDSQNSSLKRKGHRRVKSGSGKIETDTENTEYEFTIISLEGKSWQYEAGGAEERDSWVQAIEQQILNSLQSSDSEKSRINSTNSTEGCNSAEAIRCVPGNDICVDCGMPNPTWASLNLGALMCIECSGVHRNLGTHVTRVRSLDLDDWPSEVTAVMCSVGNSLANGIWEGRLGNREKPQPSSPREEKERWIRSKYETKEFLCELPASDFSLGEQLYEAVSKEDLPLCILLLAYCTPDDVNYVNDDMECYTPLHVSSILGNIVITQFLIWYFADVKKLDAKGRSPLWHAKSSGSKECADILRHNGCHDLGTLIPQGSDVIL